MSEHSVDEIIEIVKSNPLTDELREELYDICDLVHATCNEECPVYKIHGGIPLNEEKDNCLTFKQGAAMYSFIRDGGVVHDEAESGELFYMVKLTRNITQTALIPVTAFDTDDAEAQSHNSDHWSKFEHAFSNTPDTGCQPWVEAPLDDIERITKEQYDVLMKQADAPKADTISTSTLGVIVDAVADMRKFSAGFAIGPAEIKKILTETLQSSGVSIKD